jgi:hypothetical protein
MADSFAHSFTPVTFYNYCYYAELGCGLWQIYTIYISYDICSALESAWINN